MDIREFFEQSCGKWFSQRTSQHLSFNQSEWGKSDLWIELLPADDQDLIQLCEQENLNLGPTLWGVRVTWEGFVGQDPAKQHGKTVLIPVANREDSNQGKMLRKTLSPDAALATGDYLLAEDVLTMSTNYEGMTAEERLWFASPNLRLRTSVLRRQDSFSSTSFCSEIRLGDANAKPPAPSTSATRKWG
jgi:hypothetical protein